MLDTFCRLQSVATSKKCCQQPNFSQGGKSKTPVLRSTGWSTAEYKRSTAEYEWSTVEYSGVQRGTSGVQVEYEWSTGGVQ
jgi:hypothetical protein